MEETYKEVYFGEYCKTCKHEKLAEDEQPCHDCLNEPVNVYSHKPVKYEQAERGHAETKVKQEAEGKRKEK